MSLIRKNKKKVLFFVLPVFGHKKRTSQKNFFPVTNHTGQENFLKLPKKSFFSIIFICFFSFFSYVFNKEKKCFFLVLSVFGHKKRASQKNFFPVPNHTYQENFLKLPKKSFFSKIFIFTCFFNFFTLSLIRKNKKKVRFFNFAGVWSQKTHKSKKLFSSTKPHRSRKFFETTK
jgi:hypothetical protein